MRRRPSSSRWQAISDAIANPEGEVTIAIVGKYTGLKDAYKSLNEALFHGGIANKVKVKLEWIESRDLRGRGPRAVSGERRTASWCPAASASAARRARSWPRASRATRKVPYFGICFGMQMAVIEAARDLVGIKKAGSTEFGPSEEPVVGLMTEWMRGNELEKRRLGGDLGGTMRLGAYPAALAKGSRVAKIYGATQISERHRHRYEVNTHYRARLEEAGVRFCGMSPDGLLPEIVELPDHPWFIGVQFHPELKSRPFEPHPLFASFIAAAVEQSRLV